MATYVTMINWTDQGIKKFSDTTQRAQDFAEVVAKEGGRLREIVWTLGDYDIVVIFDAPDDETATTSLLRVSSLGNVRTKTMRGFTSAEMDGIIKRAG